MKQFLPSPVIVILAFCFAFLASCDPIPPLHLHNDQDIDTEIPLIEIDLDVMWHYDLAYAYDCDTFYDWRREWCYGWDELDQQLFGNIGYTEPSAFNIRRYFLGEDSLQRHTSVLRDHINGRVFRSNYQFGYYDLLVWNDPVTTDDVVSVVIDEDATLDSVTVTTNASRHASRYHAPSKLYSYNQPDELFSLEKKNFYVSRHVEDYDYYDEANRIYYKHLNAPLLPVTYIYLTQVILHHNYGRVEGTGGDAAFSNFAYSTCLNSGVAGADAVSVHYYNRMKKGIELPDTHEQVDIIGGRLTTFGLRGINPFRYTNPTQFPVSVRNGRHYMDVNVIFGNGYDTTMVFDVTNQVLQRFRGGVITVELNMDTVPIPSRAGGSGFDAVVEEWEEEIHEIEIGNIK